MPIKIDTRKKTRKQKEKNRRRKKRTQSRKRVTFTPGKNQSFTDRMKRLFRFQSSQSGKPNSGGGSAKVKLKLRSRPEGGALGTGVVGHTSRVSKSRRIPRPSMQAIHGVVANAYASRMPVGSNHTKGIYANTETGLSTKNFFKRTLRQMKRSQRPDHASLPPTYSYQTRPQPIYPHEIQVQPIGLAQPTRSLHNALRPLPAASMPRGRRQSLLREAHAQPIGTGLAEPGMPNWGQMYDATEEGRPRVTRAMTADELRKEDNYTRVQADMRTGGPGPTMGIWAPTRVRTPEDRGSAHSNSSRESARRNGKRRLSMVEENAFLKYYPQRTDLVAVAKIHGPEGQSARAQIRQLTNAVFSNSNSSLSTESNLDFLDDSPTASEREFQQTMMTRMTTLTADEVQRLRNLGLEHMIPAANLSQLERQVAIGEIRDVLADFNSSVESESVQSSIHSQYSFDDPLHLGAGEILLLRRQGPEGVEHIRRATTSADQEIAMDQVAEARAFLSAALRRPRSRSGSRSLGSRGSRSTLSRVSGSGESNTSELSVYNPGGMEMLRGTGMGRNEDAIHLTAEEETLLRGHGDEGIEYIDAVRNTPDHHARMYRVAEARNFLDRIRRTTGIGYQSMHAAAFPGSSESSASSLGSAEILTHSPLNTLTPLSSIGSLNSRGSRGSRGSRRSRRS